MKCPGYRPTQSFFLHKFDHEAEGPLSGDEGDLHNERSDKGLNITTAEISEELDPATIPLPSSPSTAHLSAGSLDRHESVSVTLIPLRRFRSNKRLPDQVVDTISDTSRTAYGDPSLNSAVPTMPHGHHHRHTSSASSYTGSSRTPSLYVTLDPDDGLHAKKIAKLPAAIHYPSTIGESVPQERSRTQGSKSSSNYDLTVVDPGDDSANVSTFTHDSAASGTSRRRKDQEQPRKRTAEEEENSKQVRFELGRAEGRAKERAEVLLAEREKHRAVEREARRLAKSHRRSPSMIPAQQEEQQRLLGDELGRMQEERRAAESHEREERAALLQQQQQTPSYYDPRSGGISNDAGMSSRQSTIRRGSISSEARPTNLARSNSRRTSIAQAHLPPISTQDQEAQRYAPTPSARTLKPPPLSFPLTFNTRPVSARRPSFSSQENPFQARPFQSEFDATERKDEEERRRKDAERRVQAVGAAGTTTAESGAQKQRPTTIVYQDPWDARSERDALLSAQTTSEEWASRIEEPGKAPATRKKLSIENHDLRLREDEAMLKNAEEELKRENREQELKKEEPKVKQEIQQEQLRRKSEIKSIKANTQQGTSPAYAANSSNSTALQEHGKIEGPPTDHVTLPRPRRGGHGYVTKNADDDRSPENSERGREDERMQRGTLAAIAGVGALAYAAGRKTKGTTTVVEDRRHRSRSRESLSKRGHSRRARSSSVTIIKSDSDRSRSRGASKHTDLKHRNNRVAQVSLASAAVAGLAIRERSKSRKREGKRSRSRDREGVPIAAAGVADAAITGLYERRKAKKEARALSRSRLEPEPVKKSATETQSQQQANDLVEHFETDSEEEWDYIDAGSHPQVAQEVVGMSLDEGRNLSSEGLMMRSSRATIPSGRELDKEKSKGGDGFDEVDSLLKEWTTVF
jgi:hypothetical protein